MIINQNEEVRWKLIINRRSLGVLLRSLGKESRFKAELWQQFYEDHLFRQSYSAEGLKDLTDFWATKCSKNGLTQMARADELQLRIYPDGRGVIIFGRTATIGRLVRVEQK